MRDSLKNIGFWVAVSIALLIAANLATEAALWATGRGGSVPCGEDCWRWHLMHLVLGIPMLLFSYIAGLVLFVYLHVRIRLRTMAVFGYNLGLQLITAFVVLIIFEWPHIFYQPPIGE